MAAALRCLCLAIAVLLGAFAVPAHAGDGGCCASHAASADEATRFEAADVAGEVADHGCGCGAACCCTKSEPVRGCDCAGAPAPDPQPAEPSLPKPPPASGAGARVLRAPPIAPDLTTAAKLRAATASGLPHVLLPGRSRQVALSVWRC